MIFCGKIRLFLQFVADNKIEQQLKQRIICKIAIKIKTIENNFTGEKFK